MAEVDSRIPLQIRVPEFSTPFETAGGALSLKQLMQNVEMHPLELQIRQEQMRGLQDYRRMMIASRAEDQRLRAEEQRRKRMGLFVGSAKDALASSLGSFLMQGDPGAAKEIYRQKMTPLWQATGYTPEQVEQAVQGWSPENVQRFLGPEGEGALLQMADRAVMQGGEGSYMLAGGDSGDLVQTAGNLPDWVSHEPQTPEEWNKWDQLIMISKSLKKEGGLTGKIEDNQFIPVPGVGNFPNPYWRRAKEADYKLRAQYKVGTGAEVNVSMGAAEQTAKTVPKAVFDDLSQSFTAAQGAIESQDTILRLRDVLSKNNAIAGIGANVRLTGAQVLNFLSGGSADQETLEQTRQIVQGLADLTIQSRKLLKGQGQVTEYEQKTLEKARSGDFTMTPTELRTLMDVFERVAQRTYNLHMGNLKRARKLPGAIDSGVDYFDPGEFPRRATAAPPAKSPATTKPAVEPSAKPAAPGWSIKPLP